MGCMSQGYMSRSLMSLMTHYYCCSCLPDMQYMLMHYNLHYSILQRTADRRMLRIGLALGCMTLGHMPRSWLAPACRYPRDRSWRHGMCLTHWLSTALPDRPGSCRPPPPYKCRRCRESRCSGSQSSCTLAPFLLAHLGVILVVVSILHYYRESCI